MGPFCTDDLLYLCSEKGSVCSSELIKCVSNMSSHGCVHVWIKSVWTYINYSLDDYSGEIILLTV